ncbi:MAG: hypothetical protein P8X65_14560 [Syntrophobacterales bacterium]|jgi:hypothetical protein
MKQTVLWIFLVGCLVAWSVPAAAQTSDQPSTTGAGVILAQTTGQPAVPPGPPPGRLGRGGRRGGPGRFFDPKTVETLVGEVVQVQRGPLGRRGRGDLVRFTLKTGKETIEVFLGPSSFVDKQSVKPAKGDRVEVKGSRQTGPQGRTFLSAAEVKKGDQVLKLRDDQGTPLWPPRQGRRGRARQS